MTIPSEYLDLTLRELLLLYRARPSECPPPLRGWLEAAVKLDELVELRRSNDEREAELALRKLGRPGTNGAQS
jgi:hypothetical protein